MSIISTVIVTHRENACKHCHLTPDDSDFESIANDLYDHDISIGRDGLAMLLLVLKKRHYSKRALQVMSRRIETVCSEPSCSVDLFPTDLVRLLADADRNIITSVLDVIFELPELRELPKRAKPRRADARRGLFRLRELSRAALKEQKHLIVRYTF